jgi:iron complex transport system substrate-binding protein
MVRTIAALCVSAVSTGVLVTGVEATSGRNITSGCVDRFDPAVDYFPDKIAVEHAEGFSVEYHRAFKVVSVKQAYAKDPGERYVLQQCGTPAPALIGALAGAQIVTVPIASLFALSPTHVPALVDLERVDVLTGVARVDAIASPQVDARIKAGGVIQFAPHLQIDVERVVTERPSILMNGGSSSATMSAVRRAGVPVVANTEWLESTALGRAEWLKYTALFLNEERKATSLFGAMNGRYQSLRARAAAVPAADRPLVMTGVSINGAFHIAGGRSYVAALIADAGARYVWDDNIDSGAPTVDFEAQLRRAADADVWINGGGWRSRAAMLEDEPRYAGFKAYRRGQVWVYERRMTARGGNDYWSRSITHPDIALADLVKIFHPELLPGHVLEWYMQVPE